MKNIQLLKPKIGELEISAKDYEAAIKELIATQRDAEEKSKNLRKAFHEDIDAYFDTVDERIKVYCSTDLKRFNVKSQNTIAKMKACVDLTAKMDNLITQYDRELFAEGEELLSQAKELLQSLVVPSIDAVEIPQVRLERGQDWILEGAVDLQLLRVQRYLRVWT